MEEELRDAGVGALDVMQFLHLEQLLMLVYLRSERL